MRPRLPDDVIELAMLVLPFLQGPEFGRCKCARSIEIGDVVRLLILRGGECPLIERKHGDDERIRDLEHALDQIRGMD